MLLRLLLFPLATPFRVWVLLRFCWDASAVGDAGVEDAEAEALLAAAVEPATKP